MKHYFKHLVVLLFLAHAIATNAQNEFITVWKTDNPGSSTNEQILFPGIGNNYTIEWEKLDAAGNPIVGATGTINNVTSASNSRYLLDFSATGTNSGAGTYRIKASSGSGLLTGFGGSSTAYDTRKLIDVTQWGNTVWRYLEYAFNSASNMTMSATDAPNLAGVTKLNNMFSGASSFNSNINHWDVSGVVRFDQMFSGASSFNQPLNGWNVSNGTVFQLMFSGTTNFNQSLSNWKLTKATNLSYMFYEGGMSKANYDNTLIGWANNPSTPTRALSLDATGLKYCAAADKRQNTLITAKSWTISGDVAECPSLTATSGEAPTITGGYTASQGAYGQPTALKIINASNVVVHTENYPANQTTFNYTPAATLPYGSYTIKLVTNHTTSHPAPSTTEEYVLAETTFSKSEKPFITVWKTDNPGSSTNEQIIFPVIGTNYTIEWEKLDATGSPITGANGVINNVTTTFLDTYLLDFRATGGATATTGAGTYRIKAISGTGSITGFTNKFFHNSKRTNKDPKKLLDVEQWGSADWTYLSQAFMSASNMTMSAKDAPKLTGVTGEEGFLHIFSGASSFNTNINHWDVSAITNLTHAFSSATSFNQPLNNWNVSNVTKFASTFRGAAVFNQPLSNWNVSNGTDFSSTFHGAASFDQNISSWNVGNGISFGGMFNRATAFNQPLSGWDVSRGTTFGGMFDRATAFNQPIGNWNVSKGTHFGQMFSHATSFNQSLENWNTISGTNFDRMFEGATVYNQPMNNWNVSSVTVFSEMFYNATAFNQPLNNWNVTNGLHFWRMFANATSFNQSLGNWNLNNPIDIEELLDNTALTKANYDNTLIGWANNATLPLGMPVGVIGLKYCAAKDKRQNVLLNTKNWTISGDAEECPTLSFSSCGLLPTITGGYKAAQGAYRQPVTIKITDGSGAVQTHTYPATQTTFSYTPTTPLVGDYTVQLVTSHTTSHPAPNTTEEYVLAETTGAAINYKDATVGTPKASDMGVSTLSRTSESWLNTKPNGQLVLESSNKGLILPEVSNPETTITGTDLVSGMIVWDVNAKCIKLYNGTNWKCIEQGCSSH